MRTGAIGQRTYLTIRSTRKPKSIQRTICNGYLVKIIHDRQVDMMKQLMKSLINCAAPRNELNMNITVKTSSRPWTGQENIQIIK